MQPLDLSLYLILDAPLCGTLGMAETARLAVAGGASVVQVRMPLASTGERIEMARAVRQAIAGSAAKLIMDDDIEAALTAGVDGLHLEWNSLSPADVRELVGPSMILGVAVHDVAAAAALDPAIVSYTAIGPVFATPTKPGHAEPLGFTGLAAVAAASRVPTVAVGGLRSEHVNDVFAAGANGIGVVSAICGRADPTAAARALRRP